MSAHAPAHDDRAAAVRRATAPPRGAEHGTVIAGLGLRAC